MSDGTVLGNWFLPSKGLSPKKNAVLVVMAGGSGTRFWPMSRKSRPKQFLPLGENGKILIQQTVDRFINLLGDHASVVVSAKNQLPLLDEYLPNVPVLAEPEPKNTAPCLGLAAHYILETVGDIPMICVPADHVIHGQKEFESLFTKALALALSDDVLITIGIHPSYPETGYGYIRRGEAYSDTEGASTGGFGVAQFVEKPDLKTAQEYVASGDFFWNSGMFVWRPSVFVESLKKFLPEENALCKKYVAELQKDTPSEQSLSDMYHSLQSVSVDVGVMENASNTVMFPGYGFTWSDVGSWDSWAETARADFGDTHQNVSIGDSLFINSSNCVVVDAHAWGDVVSSTQARDEKKKLALVGVQDLIVVDAGDSLLVCKRSEAQQVKQIVESLKKSNTTRLI